MKSGSLGKLTTRPNTWELLYNNSVDTVCTFDLYVTNKENIETSIDLLITPIPLHLLPPNEADYLLTNKLIDSLSSYDKKGIVIGEFDYVYVRSQITVCVVSVNGFIDELSNGIGITAYYHLVNEGGKSSSVSNTTNFVLITENVIDSTPVPYVISGITLSRIQSIFINGVSKTVSLTGNFIVDKKYSVLKVVLIDNVLTNDGEKITVSCNGHSVNKSVNVSQPVITPTYNLIPYVTTVEEGNSIVLNLHTTNIPTGSEFFVRYKPLLGSPSGALIGEYDVGVSPCAMAYDSSSNAVWVVNKESNFVSKINAVTGAIIGNYTVGTSHADIAYDPVRNIIWLGNYGFATGNLLKINASTGVVITGYDVDVAIQCIAFNHNDNTIWVASRNNSTVASYNGATGALISRYTPPSQPEAMVYDSINNAVWISCINGKLVKLNANTGSLISEYKFTNYTLTNLTYIPTKNSLWASNIAELFCINATTGVVTYKTYEISGTMYHSYDHINEVLWLLLTSKKLIKLNVNNGIILASYTIINLATVLIHDPVNNTLWMCDVNNSTNTASKYSAGFSLASSDDIIELNNSTNKLTVSNNYGTLSIPVHADSSNEESEKIVFELLDKNNKLVATSPVINLLDKILYLN